MNRLYTILYMACMLVFCTSCKVSDMNMETPDAGTDTRAVDQRVQILIQQARDGDIEAYNSLALCYRLKRHLIEFDLLIPYYLSSVLSSV